MYENYETLKHIVKIFTLILLSDLDMIIWLNVLIRPLGPIGDIGGLKGKVTWFRLVLIPLCLLGLHLQKYL